MTRPERMIGRQEVTRISAHGEVIEDHTTPPERHNSLMRGFGVERRPIHVVYAPENEYLAIITACLPDPNEWSDNGEKSLCCRRMILASEDCDQDRRCLGCLRGAKVVVQLSNHRDHRHLTMWKNLYGGAPSCQKTLPESDHPAYNRPWRRGGAAH